MVPGTIFVIPSKNPACMKFWRVSIEIWCYKWIQSGLMTEILKINWNQKKEMLKTKKSKAWSRDRNITQTIRSNLHLRVFLELTGILTSSLSNPSLPVILTLSFRDHIPEKGALDPSSPEFSYTLGFITSMMGSRTMSTPWSMSSSDFCCILLTGTEVCFRMTVKINYNSHVGAWSMVHFSKTAPSLFYW